MDDLSAEADDEDSKGIHIQDESTWFSIWSKFGSEANDVNTADYIAEVKVELK